jgi:tetratricopeptide (TPR) repeat protein
LAQIHLEKALFLEEDLVEQGLTHIRWSGLPAEKWGDLLPDSLSSRRQLLQALAGSGYRAEAVALLEGMVQSSPEKGLLRQVSSWALQWGEPELALEAAERWREEERANGTRGIQLARATLQVVRVHMALDAPDTAHQIYVEALDEMGEPSRASRPARLELMNGMGYEYLRQGQTVLARSTFLKARALAPFHVDSSLGLARAYSRAGDRKLAIEQYQRVLELDRHHEVARRELEGLLADEGVEVQR